MHGRQHQGVVGRLVILLAQKQHAFREWTVQPRQDVICGIDSALARLVRHKLEHPFAHAIENEGKELAFTERLPFRQLLQEIAILVDCWFCDPGLHQVLFSRNRSLRLRRSLRV
ncbi:hypothetical protein D3C80_1654820 [compost metagenome]